MRITKKQIPNYPNYIITSEGNVINTKTNHILKPSITCGYYHVCLYNENNSKNYRIHRLVGELLIPNPKNKKEINHKDGNKLNNNINNLEWVTSKENMEHAVNLGLHNNKGEKQHLSKLTELQVLQIRSILEQNFANQIEVANAYNVSGPTIMRIKKMITWKHV